METRPGEVSGVHVSSGQVDSIRASLERHIHGRLQERLAQLGDYEDGGEDRDELERLLATNIEGRFLDMLMQELCRACVVDDDDNGNGRVDADNESADRKIEPYDFALNDRLRTTYQQFEDLVEDTCRLRRDVPPQLSEAVHQRLAADMGLVHELVSGRTAATAVVLATTETSTPPHGDIDLAPLDNVLQALLNVKTAVAQTVLSADTMARVARFE